MTTPRSQAAAQRPISFILQDLGNGNDITSVTLVIRPEELTLSEPSRTSVQQTLGGAWVDSFGVGIREVNISGNTGWRGGVDGDGEEQFRKLNNAVFRNWHRKRDAARESGRDPAAVNLIFADLLNDRVYVCVPMVFQLFRSRSNPLLMMYKIRLLVISDDLTGLKDALKAGANPALGQTEAALSKLDELLNGIRDASEEIAGLIDSGPGAAAKRFMNLTADVLSTTVKTVDSLEGSIDVVAESLISVSSDLAWAGYNIMATVASIEELPMYARTRVMQVAASYNYAFCLLGNALSGIKRYGVYDDWYGASNCSSLGGGRPDSPLRFENPFYRLARTDYQPVTVSTGAREAITYMQNMDPLDGTSTTELSARMSQIAAGIQVTPNE